jgi:hypothetical protein
MNLAASGTRCAIVVALVNLIGGACGRSGGGHADGGAGTGGSAAGTAGAAGDGGSMSAAGGGGQPARTAGGAPDGGGGAAGGKPPNLDDLLNHDGGAGVGTSISPGMTPACGASKCGNGTRDSCLVTGNDGTISSPMEACDGADLGGVSCTGEGWGSGAVKCSSNCTLDRSGCSACMPTGGAVQGCEHLALPTRDAWTIGLAANATEVAVTWASSENPATPVLEFARLAPGLGVLGTVELESTEHSMSSVSFNNVALAPLSPGWVVAAADSARKLFIHALDATGADLGRVDVATVPGGTSSQAFLSLAPRAGGGPCLFWGAQAGVQAAMVAPDGRSVGKASDVVVLDGLVNVGVSQVASLGGACFAVVAGQEAATMAPVTRLLRFDAGGGAPTVVNVVKGELVTGPRLVAGANDLLLAYASVSGGTASHTLRRFLATGVESAAALPLDPAATLLAAAADEAMFVMTDPTGLTLSVEWLSRTGAVVMPPTVVAKSPSAILAVAGGAHRASDTVVGWAEQRPGAPAVGVAVLPP